MNPKSMPREQLLGHMDMDTREWFDGVLTASARKVVREPPDVKSWIICDGDIDPEWVESLNSVLDDNRPLLTMPSGERINSVRMSTSSSRRTISNSRRPRPSLVWA